MPDEEYARARDLKSTGGDPAGASNAKAGEVPVEFWLDGDLNVDRMSFNCYMTFRRQHDSG